MSVVVPDASVILKWVLPAEHEPDVDQALAIRQQFAENRIRLLLPSLWVYEVGNILNIKQPDYARDALTALVNMQIPEAKQNPRWQEQIFDLAERTGVSFYDASYHALAIVEDGIFVTADKKYIDKVGQNGHIIQLCDWSMA